MERVDPVFTSEVLRGALTQLGLSKTLLAQVFNVSRQTIYEWLDGESQPQLQHQPKLALIQAMCADEELQAHPLNRRWSKHPAHHGRSLFETLNQDEPALNEVQEVISALKAEAAQWRVRQAEDHAQPTACDELEREVNLMLNLTALEDKQRRIKAITR